MLRLHERTTKVTAARYDLEEAFWKWYNEHEDLGYIETLQCLSHLQETVLKFALRAERHPSEDCEGYKADEECRDPVCREAYA